MGDRVNVSVVGAGKMGLPLACALADRGARVTACDVNLATVEKINTGAAPFEEPGLTELLRRVVSTGNLKATQDTSAAVADSQVCIVIVPVKLTSNKTADLATIESATRDVAKGLRAGTLVSFETTLPVGQTRRLGRILESGGLRVGVDFDLAFSPERVKSQTVIRQLHANPKVVGGATPSAAARAEKFYREVLGAPTINVGSLEAAEFVKLAGMVYRDVNIALANELAGYAYALGLDFAVIRDAANTDGEAHILAPGIGVGGHCTPVYPYFLTHDAAARNIDTVLAANARRINEAQPGRMLARAGGLSGKKVVILGLGFRPQVKEAAYSPAFSLRDEIEQLGGSAFLHDPLFTEAEIRHFGFEPARIEDAEVLVLNTAHDSYRSLDFVDLARAGVKTIVDGRDLWDGQVVTTAGLAYVGVGKPAPVNGSRE